MSALVKLASLVLLVFFNHSVFSSADSNKATQLIKVSQGLKENIFYLKAIAPSVSNYGDELDEKIFTRALQHQIETEILQLQFDLGLAYSEMRRTQEITIQLYYRILEANIANTEMNLIRLTKLSYGKEKTSSHHYLQMGFREIAVAKQKFITAKNTHPQLYLMKLQDASYALRSIKQAQKYVIQLALLHDGAYESEEDALTDFNALKLEIQRVLTNDLDLYMRFHYDANFQVYDRKNIFEEIWNEPRLHELANPLEGVDASYVRRPTLPEVPSP